MPRSFFRVRKQADEQRNITRRATLKLGQYFQENRLLSFLKDYVPKPHDPVKKFDGISGLVQPYGDILGAVKVGRGKAGDRPV
jgi:hypothetical protein